MRNIRITDKQFDATWLLCIKGFIRCIGMSKRIIIIIPAPVESEGIIYTKLTLKTMLIGGG